jgi:hypothetical protein
LNKATRITASILGIYAALLGIEHGVFETLQGNAATDGLMINAIGPPCQADTVWHACFPALTVIPNYAATGIAAIIAGLAVSIWAAAFVQRKHGALILIALSILMALVGGGFVPTFAGIIAGVAGSRIHAPLNWWRAHRSGGLLRFLARLWPWPLVILAAWLAGGWILGHFFNQVMMNLVFILFLCIDLGLPILAVLAGCAHDIQEIAE